MPAGFPGQLLGRRGGAGTPGPNSPNGAPGIGRPATDRAAAAPVAGRPPPGRRWPGAVAAASRTSTGCTPPPPGRRRASAGLATLRPPRAGPAGSGSTRRSARPRRASGRARARSRSRRASSGRPRASSAARGRRGPRPIRAQGDAGVEVGTGVLEPPETVGSDPAMKQRPEPARVELQRRPKASMAPARSPAWSRARPTESKSGAEVGWSDSACRGRGRPHPSARALGVRPPRLGHARLGPRAASAWSRIVKASRRACVRGGIGGELDGQVGVEQGEVAEVGGGLLALGTTPHPTLPLRGER